MSTAGAVESTSRALPEYRQPTRRNTELVLLIAALFVGGFALVSVDLAILSQVQPATIVTLVVMSALLLIAHIMVRLTIPYADPVMLPVVAALNLLGVAMIHRLDLAEQLRAERVGSATPTPDLPSQLTWTGLGVALFVAVVLVVRDHRRLARFTYTALFIGLLLLILPLLPVIGTTVNGATLWVRAAGFSFQPAELAKIALTIFFAGYLVVTRDSLALVRSKFLGLEFPRGRDLGPLIVAWLISLGVLVFERDLGTSLLFFGLFVSMLYVATQRRSWLVLGTFLFVVGATLSYFAFGHVRVRVQVWIDPFADSADSGYQIVQSLFGLANGGLLGAGLGQGYPQLVPFAKTDFIMAAFGEELGLAGVMAMLMLYAILIERGMRTGIACRDAFGTLLATGLSLVLALQVFVVIGGVTRLIPLTGLTTPFLSYGGSSLVANWMVLALLMRMSHASRSPDPVLTPVVRPASVEPAV
jgi:cell division protein FtsW (lipid II flippase)